MSKITLKPLDDGQKSVEIPVGKTTIGRGSFLGCNDKRVSRNHAVLEVTSKGEVYLTPIHANPCFYPPTVDRPFQILKKDIPHKLENGDSFSLLPRTFRYRLIVTSENTEDKTDQNDLNKQTGKTNGAAADCGEALLNERNKDAKNGKGISNEELNDGNNVPSICQPSDSSMQTEGTTASCATSSVQTSSSISCLENLSWRILAKLLDLDVEPDVEFQCAGESTAAHRAVLSVRSPVLASMLSSDTIEKRTGVIKIPDMQPDVFKHFLGYIYNGTLPELTVDLAMNLYESGHQYAVHGLAKRCSEFLVEHLSVESACDVLVVADAHSDKDLTEVVMEYMLDNDVLWASHHWLDFCDNHSKLATKILNRLLNLVPRKGQLKVGESIDKKQS